MAERTGRVDIALADDLLGNLLTLEARAYCVALFTRKGLPVVFPDTYRQEAIDLYTQKGRTEVVDLLQGTVAPKKQSLALPPSKPDALEVMIASAQYEDAAASAAKSGRYLDFVSYLLRTDNDSLAESFYRRLLDLNPGERKTMVTPRTSSGNGTAILPAKSVVQLSGQSPEILEAQGKFQEAVTGYSAQGRADEAVVVAVNHSLFLSAYTICEEKKKFDIAAVVALCQENERKHLLYKRLDALVRK